MNKKIKSRFGHNLKFSHGRGIALIHIWNLIILSVLTIHLFLREVGLNLQNYFSTILLPQTDLIGEYLYSRNIQSEGNPWSAPLLNYPDGSYFSIPFNLLFDFRRWFILWFQIKPLGIDAISAVNVQIMFGFILSAASMYYVLCRLKVSHFLSFSLALLWTISPWHILRIQHGFAFVDLSPIVFTLLFVAMITAKDLEKTKFELRRFEIIFMSAWIMTSGTYYIYFSFLCLLISVVYTKLIIPTSMYSKNHKKSPSKFYSSWGALFLISSTTFLALQYLLGKFLVSLNSQVPDFTLARTYPDIWMYGGFVSPLFTSFTAPFNSIFDKFYDAANILKPGSLCTPDVVQSKLMEISCSRNFESFMFLNTGLTIVSLISFLVLVYLRFANSPKFLITSSKRNSKNPALANTVITDLRPNFLVLMRRLVFTNFTLTAIATTGAGSSILGLVLVDLRVYGRLLIYVVGLSVLISAIFFRDFFDLSTKLRDPKSANGFMILILVISFLPSPVFAKSFLAYQEVQKSYMEATSIIAKSLAPRSNKCIFLQLPGNTSIYPNTNRQIVFTQQQLFPYLLGLDLPQSAGVSESSKIEKMNLQLDDTELFKATLSDSKYCFVSILESEDKDYLRLRFTALDLGARLVYKSQWSLALNKGQIKQRFYLYELQTTN